MSSKQSTGLTSKFYTAEHDICDGAVKLLRTKQSGDVWQMRCWISAEKRYVKKSLRTRDLEQAKEIFRASQLDIEAQKIKRERCEREATFEQLRWFPLPEDIHERLS